MPSCHQTVRVSVTVLSRVTGESRLESQREPRTRLLLAVVTLTTHAAMCTVAMGRGV